MLCCVSLSVLCPSSLRFVGRLLKHAAGREAADQGIHLRLALSSNPDGQQQEAIQMVSSRKVVAWLDVRETCSGGVGHVAVVGSAASRVDAGCQEESTGWSEQER